MRVWRCLTYGLLLQMLVMGIGLAEGGLRRSAVTRGVSPPNGRNRANTLFTSVGNLADWLGLA